MSQEAIAAQTNALFRFQSQLKNKIQFKVSSKVSNDAVLFKAFKFFDLYNNGYLSKTQFFKAIAKCGVVVETHDLNRIYNYYDPKNTGKIDYRVFIQNLLFNNASQTSSENLEKSQLHQEKKPVVEQKNYSYNSPKQSSYHPETEKKSQIISHHTPSNELKESHYRKQPQNYEQTIELIINDMKEQGICGLLNLANQFKSTDHQRTHLINAQKMAQCLKNLSWKGLDRIISQYNPNKFGQINYAQFIYGLKGNMNSQRQSLVDDLFNMLDVEQKGQIQINKFINAHRNKIQLGNFKKAIDLYCKFQSIDDGIFTDQDFNDFFEFISFTFPSDQEFNDFVKIRFYSDPPPKSNSSHKSSRREFEPKKQQSAKSGNRPNQTPKPDFRKNKQQQQQQQKKQQQYRPSDFSPQQQPDKKSQISQNSKRSQNRSSKSNKIQIPQVKQINMIFLRMKKTLASKGTRGFLLFQKLLKSNDTDLDGKINIQQFKQVIKDQKIDITALETIQIFGIFDQFKNGLVPYQELVQTIKGEIPQSRLAMIPRIWDRVKMDDDHTTFSKVKSSLNFRNHPDIQTGRKEDQQVWHQIQQTILMIQDLNDTARSDTIYKEVFQEYCANLSLSISEDQLFESIAQNFWKIGPLSKIENEYAGSRKIFDRKKSAYLQDHHRYAYNGGSVSQNAPFGTFNIPTNYTTEHQKL